MKPRDRRKPERNGLCTLGIESHWAPLSPSPMDFDCATSYSILLEGLEQILMYWPRPVWKQPAVVKRPSKRQGVHKTHQDLFASCCPVFLCLSNTPSHNYTGFNLTPVASWFLQGANHQLSTPARMDALQWIWRRQGLWKQTESSRKEVPSNIAYSHHIAIYGNHWQSTFLKCSHATFMLAKRVRAQEKKHAACVEVLLQADRAELSTGITGSLTVLGFSAIVTICYQDCYKDCYQDCYHMLP